jgi:DNA-binding IclR family transcriptional regulator
VLNFFAAHPEQAFTLTDIVRSLGLNRATCHSLLAALVDEGYLYRDNAKAYRLGPALAALGEAAHRSFKPVAIARDGMRRLADERRAVCIGAARVGGEMVILERAAGAPELGHELYPGRRFPLRPPSGVSFIAWAPKTEVREWLDTCKPALSDENRTGWRATFERIRRQAFCFGVADPYEDAWPETAVGAPPPLQPDHNPKAASAPPSPIISDQQVRLRYVSAPVLDAAGEIIFSVALHGFTRLYSEAEIRELGRDLKVVADHVTLATGGAVTASPNMAAIPYRGDGSGATPKPRVRA